MEVNFKSPQTLGNKNYKAGKQIVHTHLASNVKFKELVKSGEITILAKSKSDQDIQKLKDESNAKKAEIARQLTHKMKAEKNTEALNKIPAPRAAGVQGKKS